MLGSNERSPPLDVLPSDRLLVDGPRGRRSAAPRLLLACPGSFLLRSGSGLFCGLPCCGRLLPRNPFGGLLGLLGGRRGLPGLWLRRLTGRGGFGGFAACCGPALDGRR